MKLALCSTGVELSSTLDERFGRANYFILYNTESSEMDVIKNSAKEAAGGAGGLSGDRECPRAGGISGGG